MAILDLNQYHLERWCKSPSINEGLSILLIAFHEHWMDLIITYLPKDKLEAKNLRLREARCVTIGKTFYKRGFSMPYVCTTRRGRISIARGAQGSIWQPCSKEISSLMNIKAGITIDQPWKMIVSKERNCPKITISDASLNE